MYVGRRDIDVTYCFLEPATKMDEMQPHFYNMKHLNLD